MPVIVGFGESTLALRLFGEMLRFPLDIKRFSVTAVFRQVFKSLYLGGNRSRKQKPF